MPRPAASVPVDDLPNLGPKSGALLRAAGIDSVQTLRRLGAVAAFSIARRHSPGVTLNLLWALDGALNGVSWQQVAREHRTSLLMALEAHENPPAPVAPPKALAGYSGTTLARKLGLTAGMRVVARRWPDGFAALLEPLPDGIRFDAPMGAAADLAHFFVEWRKDLSADLLRSRRSLRPDVPVWVSWPKKSSKRPTDITEDTIREVALPLGYVDIKVCAVDAVWSGLKLVVRQEYR